jgi:hypothetical protein
MRGKLLDRERVATMHGDDLWLGGSYTGCAGTAYGWSGAGDGYKTNVWVNGDGTRVAVLLLNARGDSAADATAGTTLTSLYCAA